MLLSIKRTIVVTCIAWCVQAYGSTRLLSERVDEYLRSGDFAAAIVDLEENAQTPDERFALGILVAYKAIIDFGQDARFEEPMKLLRTVSISDPEALAIVQQFDRAGKSSIDSIRWDQILGPYPKLKAPLVVRIERADWEDARVMTVPWEHRVAWVSEMVDRQDADVFARDYLWLLEAGEINERAARQIAYLYLYSTRRMGGYFEGPVVVKDKFKFQFHIEPRIGEGFPVYVDRFTGKVRQAGYLIEEDMKDLLRIFVEVRSKKERQFKRI